jgi:hypothetical protein
MTPEQRAAIESVLSALTQFAYGPIGPEVPFTGLVELPAEQYRALEELVKTAETAQ